MNLDSIVILYRDRNLGLWGISYPMRRDIGQEPRHLDAAGNTKGWIWLGSPGWFGSMNAAEMEATRAFLAKCGDLVPGNPFEWSRIKEDP